MPLRPPNSEGRQLAALAAPIAATQLAQIAVSTTNLAFMGTLGVAQLAAGGLAVVLFNQIRTMCVGLIAATGNQVAHLVGGADARPQARVQDEIRDVVRSGLLVATVAGLVGAAALIGFGWVLPLLGQNAAVLADARPMMLALAPGLLPCLWFQALRQYSIGMQRPMALLAVTLGSVALNAVLALGLCHGLYGLPRWGLTGIGVAMSLGFLVSCAVLAAMVRRDPVLGPTLPRTPWPVRMSMVRAELRLGTPIALTYGSEAGMFSILALAMGAISPAALAAHNVVYQLVYIVFQVAVGLSHGASILVSRAVAAGDYPQAQRLPRLALRRAAVVVALVGLVYLAAPNPVLRLFTDRIDAATLHQARILLLVAIVLQFVDAAQNIAVGLLRGLKDTGAGFRLSFIGYWVVGVPTALALAFPAGLGAVGIWLGLTTGLATTAALMLRRYHTLLATRAEVDQPSEPATAT